MLDLFQTYSSIVVRSTDSQVSLHSSTHHQEYRGTHGYPATHITEISQIVQNISKFTGVSRVFQGISIVFQKSVRDVPLKLVYCRAMAGSIEGPMRVDLCVSRAPMIPFLLHRMRKYSQYIKSHVGCIVGPWQGPLKDQ